MSEPREPSGFIDLHAHTTESDGTYSPAEIVRLACDLGLDALAVTDHDTFSGYEKAEPVAREMGLDLIRGIELNTRYFLEGRAARRSAHILAYFLNGMPGRQFTEWLEEERQARRERNQGLVQSLQQSGVNIELSEVEERGKTLAGRPHFASILIEKGYAGTSEEAFRRYLGEQAPSFVERQSKSSEHVIGIIRDAGGIPVVAHPVRLHLERAEERALIARFKDAGLLGLEIYHSEHPPELQAYYRQLAEELNLVPTGGSDFHGAVKPQIQLGTGANGNLRVPADFLAGLRITGAVFQPAREK
jgi:3',5'-nucleoside bisphosphate phosphatase